MDKNIYKDAISVILKLDKDVSLYLNQFVVSLKEGESFMGFMKRALFAALALPVLLFLSGMANAGTVLSADCSINDGKIANVVDRGSGSLFVVASMSDAYSVAHKVSEPDIGDSLSVAFDQAVVLGRGALISSGSMHSGNSFSTNSGRGLGDHRSTNASFNAGVENSDFGGGHSGLSTTGPAMGAFSG